MNTLRLLVHPEPDSTARFAQLTVALLVLVSGSAVTVWLRRMRRDDLAFGAAAATLTLLPSPWDWPISAAMVVTSLLCLALLPLARRAPRLRALRRARVAFLRMPEARFDAALFGVGLLLYLAVGALVFGWIPAIQDTQAQVFHAELFARGLVTADPPPGPPELFAADNMILNQRWYGQYPPGHTAMLALGVLVGAPFVVNPLLGALTLVLVRRFVDDAFGRRLGRSAAVLVLVSPFVLYMNSEFMNHTSALLAAVMLAWGTHRGLRESARPMTQLGWGAVAGSGAGWMLLVRPLTAVTIGLPFGLWIAWATLRRPRANWPVFVGSVLSAAICVALLFWFQDATNGHLLRSGYSVCYPHFRYGFYPCPNVGLPVGPPFGPVRAIEHTLSNLSATNLFALGGPLPAIGLAAVGAWHLRAHTMARALILSCLCLIVGYFFLCWQDLTFGPRYLYEASLATLPFVAAALPVIGRAFAGAQRWMAPRFAVLAVLFGPLAFGPAIGFYYATAYSHRGGITAIAEREIDERALVFVDGRYHRAFHANTPWLDGRIIYARDLGDEINCQGVRAFPDRAPYRARGDTLEAYPDACRGD